MKNLNTAVRLAATTLLMAVACAAGAQQDYPNKMIRFIVPYPPGGSATPLVRFVARN